MTVEDRAWDVCNRLLGHRWAECAEEDQQDVLDRLQVVVDALREAVSAEREACARLADFWANDEGQSPNHGQGLIVGMKMAGRETARAIRARSQP